MITGPKYKIARRLGAPIFEKTQTQKFKLSEEKKKGGKRKRGGFGGGTNFSIQLKEKQKARFTYGVSEKQFKNYVKKIIDEKISKPTEVLYSNLENRLDNVISRIGLGSTRSFSRQLVAHGHITVNGKKVDIPSYSVEKGDLISIREASRGKPVFKTGIEMANGKELPVWIIKSDKNGKDSWMIQDIPKLEGANLLFDLESVIQYYKRG